MRSLILFSTLLPALTRAHFALTYPAQRPAQTEQQGTGPCSGTNTPTSNRTSWPVTGGPINLRLGHDRSLIGVYLAVGSSPGPNSFNITLLPTIQEQGPGVFCLPNVRVPSGTAGVTEGASATLQVITNGESGGGLYNCADITFVASGSSAFSAPSCSNATGTSVVPYSGGPPNGTAQGTTTGSGTAAAASATKTGGAVQAMGGKAGEYFLGGALALGVAALL